MGVRIPHGSGQYWGGKGLPLYRNTLTLRSSVQKQLNRSRCRLGFGSVGPKESRVRWGPDPRGKEQFWRRGGAHCKVSAMSCAKTAEPSGLPFGLWTWVGRRRHEFSRIHQVAPMYPHGTTWRIQLNRPSVATMRSYVKLLWPLVCGTDSPRLSWINDC